jgi:D-glycero-D-manno-heptose 1,7-bisphosphate phosphatase
LGLSIALRPAVFFDRDGCLNDDIGYLHRIEQFRWLPGAIAAVRLANQAGALTFVVTNQSGIARGLYTPGDVEAIHAWMSGELARHGARINAYRFCPHHPTAGDGPYTRRCYCRKPEPGMVRELISAWGVDPNRSFMVGDMPRDVAAAESAGIAGYQVAPGKVLAAVRRGLRKHCRRVGR